MFLSMHDTSAEAIETQLAAFRRLSPAARVALALEASDWLMAVARARMSAEPRAPALANALPADPPQAVGVPSVR